MAGTETFSAILKLVDQTSPALRNITARFAAMTDRTSRFRSGLTELGEHTGIARLSENVEGANRKFHALGDTIGSLAGPLQTLGAAATLGGLIEMAKKTAEFGQDLYIGSIKTGMAADQLAKFHYAAKVAHVDAGEFDVAMQRLNVSIAEAASGKNQNLVSMFRHLGISVRDARGHIKSAAEIFPDLAKAMKVNPDVAMQERILKTAAGRGGAALLPMIADGPEGVKAAGDRFDKFHGAVTPEDIERAHEMAEAFDDLGLATEGLGHSIGYSLFPWLHPVITGMSNFVAQHRDLAGAAVSSTAALAGIALVSSGPVLTAMKALASPITFTTLKLFRGFKLAYGAIAEVTTGLRLGFSVFESLSLAIAANPIGMLIIGLVAVAAIAYVIYRNWAAIKNFFGGALPAAIAIAVGSIGLLGAAVWALGLKVPLIGRLGGAVKTLGLSAEGAAAKVGTLATASTGAAGAMNNLYGRGLALRGLFAAGLLAGAVGDLEKFTDEEAKAKAKFGNDTAGFDKWKEERDAGKRQRFGKYAFGWMPGLGGIDWNKGTGDETPAAHLDKWVKGLLGFGETPPAGSLAAVPAGTPPGLTEPRVPGMFRGPPPGLAAAMMAGALAATPAYATTPPVPSVHWPAVYGEGIAARRGALPPALQFPAGAVSLAVPPELLGLPGADGQGAGGASAEPPAIRFPPIYGQGAVAVPAPTAAKVEGQVNVKIDIGNAPPGTRVRTSSSGDLAPPEIDLGYAFAGGLP